MATWTIETAQVSRMTIITANYNLCQLKNGLKEFEFGKLLKFLTVADNKDKLLKVLQYIVKLVLVTKGAAASGNSTDFKSFASTLSLARKLGRLGNWLPGVNDLYDLAVVAGAYPSSSSDYILKVLSASASVGNDLLDDWICLQKGRLLRKEAFLDNLDIWSTRLWFVSVSIDLNFTLRKLKSLRSSSKPDKDEDEDYKRKELDLILAAGKQCCDWIFCVWELADLGKYNGSVPVIAGLSAAVIGAIRGYRKIK